MKNDIDFIWTGIDSLGNKISGKIKSGTKVNAGKKLASRAITVLTLKKELKSVSSFKKTSFSKKHLLDFTQQLQLLLHAGIPLIDALTLIEKTAPLQTTALLIDALILKISAGINLASALNEFPQHFNSTYCCIISAGEQSGQLDNVLLQLIDMIERQLQIKNKIMKALFYPLIVGCIAIAITAAMLIFVIPQFSAIYNNFGAKLPKMTRLLITASHLIHQHSFSIALIITSIIALSNIILKKINRTYDFLQKLFFIITPLRSLIITHEIAQWSQLLATTLSSRIPLVDALHIANQAVFNPLLKNQLQKMKEALMTGKSFHQALACCTYFPARAKHLIAVGENADALDTMLKKISVIYQNKLNDALLQITQLIEPLLMIGVASLIAGLIIAMYLPIFRMGSII